MRRLISRNAKGEENMKRLILAAMMLCLLLSSARAQTEIPGTALARAEKAYPGYDVLTADGYDDGTSGQWALVMTKQGHNVLVIAERRDGGAYQIMLDNPAALPREGEGYSRDTHEIRAALTKKNQSDRLSFLEMTIEQPGVMKWVITSELADDEKTWGNVVSEYTSYDGDGQTVWWSHILAQDATLNYMRFEEDLQGRPVSSASYPRIPVGGEMAAAHLLDCFDAARYPCKPDEMNGPSLSQYAGAYVSDGHRLVQIDLQKDALILLTQDPQGVRSLRILPHENWRFLDAIEAGPLPENAMLDLFHASEGEVQIEWQQGETAYSFCFEQWALHGWAPAWLMINSETFLITQTSIACADEASSPMRNDNVHYGDHPLQMIQRIDFSAMPATKDELLALLDPGSHALVNNPNPEDRLHLRELPRKDARSKGRFYNRTPVRVHAVNGEWASVSVGAISGYMMVKYLAFGDEMDGVQCAFPQMFIREGIDSLPLQWWKQEGEAGRIDRGTQYDIVGVDGERYILLTRDGAAGYVNQSDFWPGNG